MLSKQTQGVVTRYPVRLDVIFRRHPDNPYKFKSLTTWTSLQATMQFNSWLSWNMFITPVSVTKWPAFTLLPGTIFLVHDVTHVKLTFPQQSLWQSGRTEGDDWHSPWSRIGRLIGRCSFTCFQKCFGRIESIWRHHILLLSRRRARIPPAVGQSPF